MPDEALKLFAHDGPWVALCAVMVFLLYRTNERHQTLGVQTMKEISASQIKHAEAMTVLAKAIDTLYVTVMEMNRAMNRHP